MFFRVGFKIPQDQMALNIGPLRKTIYSVSLVYSPKAEVLGGLK